MPETINPVHHAYLTGETDEKLVAARDEYRAKAHTFDPDLARTLRDCADEIDQELAYRARERGHEARMAWHRLMAAQPRDFEDPEMGPDDDPYFVLVDPERGFLAGLGESGDGEDGGDWTDDLAGAMRFSDDGDAGTVADPNDDGDTPIRVHRVVAIDR